MSSQQLNTTNVNYKYKVSVIVPCYNVLPWIDQCLESLVNQTLKAIEIIAVNDGSTDDTGNRLDEWQAKYPNKIKVIHKNNGGLATARDAGMQIAKGECIGFVDADDWVDISMYAVLYKNLSLKKLDFVYAKIYCFNDNTKGKEKNKLELPEVIELNKVSYTHFKKIILQITNTWGSIFLQNFLKRNKIGCLFTNNGFADEIPFLFSCIMKANRIGVVNNYLYYYRTNRIGQLTSMVNIKHFIAVFQELNYIENNIVLNNKNFNNLFLIRKLTIHAAVASQIVTNLKKMYISNAAYNIFNKHAIFNIYKQSMYLTFVRNWRYLPFTILLNIFFMFKKLSMPKCHKE